MAHRYRSAGASPFRAAGQSPDHPRARTRGTAAPLRRCLRPPCRQSRKALTMLRTRVGLRSGSRDGTRHLLSPIAASGEPDSWPAGDRRGWPYRRVHGPVAAQQSSISVTHELIPVPVSASTRLSGPDDLEQHELALVVAVVAPRRPRPTMRCGTPVQHDDLQRARRERLHTAELAKGAS